jgi:ribosomal protein L32
MKKTKKTKKVKKRVEEEHVEACEKCGESEVDLETMPCCGKLICWDFCLSEIPTECPFCGESIRVEPKDELTKESYVEVMVPTVELTKEANRLLKECRKAFDKKKLPSDSEIVEGALNSYLCDLHPV